MIMIVLFLSFVFFIFFLSIKEAHAEQTIINEVMYNPIGDDNNKEFIEIFMQTPSSLENFIIADASSNDSLTVIKYDPTSLYAVIVEEGFNTTIIKSTNASFYNAGATIGNNLNNDKDNITVYSPNGTILATYSYNGSLANNNDFSIERNASGYFESKQELGTPGGRNSIETEEVQTTAKTGANSDEQQKKTETVEEGTRSVEENKEEDAKEEGEEGEVVIPQINNTINSSNLLNSSNAINSSETISIQILLPERFFINRTYQNIFKVVNKKYARGSKQGVNITLFYELRKSDEKKGSNESGKNDGGEKGNEMEKSNEGGKGVESGEENENEGSEQNNEKSTFLENVLSSRTVGTGTINIFDEGLYLLCVYGGTNESRTAEICRNSTAISAANVPCDLAVTINTEKEIYENNKKIEFTPNITNEGMENKEFPITLAYTITDLFNNTLQKTKITESINKKSYTPRIEQRVDVLIVQTELKEVICKDTNRENNAFSKMIIVKNHAGAENSITIDKIPDEEVFFGAMIKPQITITTAEKASASIKIYVENRDEQRITNTYYLKPESVGSMQFTLPLEIRENCNNQYPEGTYNLIVEGIGIKKAENIVIKNDPKKCAGKQGNSEYSITSFEEEIAGTQQFNTDVTLVNNDESMHNYSLWSYVYRGSKSYSGYRLENIQTTMLESKTSRKVTLRNSVKDLEPGSYKFKVQIQKDDQQTTANIVKEITVTISGGKRTEQQAEEKNEGITSFYTKAKHAQETIHLFSTIKGEGNYTLVLETMKEKETIPLEINKENKNNKTMLAADLVSGKNMYLLKLLKNNKTIDSKDLVLFNINNKIFSGEKGLDEKELETIQQSGGENKITGRTIQNKEIYTSTASKINELITPLIIVTLLSLLGSCVPVMKKKMKAKLFK